MRRAPHLAAAFTLLSAACKPDPGATTTAAAPPSTPEPPAPTSGSPAALTPAQAATWAQLDSDPPALARAVVIRRGAVRLAKEGPVALEATGDPAWDTRPVIAVDGDRVRVSISGNGSFLSMLVWLDAADLGPQLQRVTQLDPEGAAKPGDGTVELAPGEPIEIVERADARVHVRTHDSRFDGWIDATALGPTYTPAPFERPPLDALLPGGTAIAVRPGGRPLHTLAPIDDGKWEAHVLPGTKRGWLEVEHVEFCHPTVRVRGWVRDALVQRLAPDAGSGFGCSASGTNPPARWGDLEAAPVVELAADAKLFAPDGELIGRTHAPTKLRRAPDGLLRVSTQWGRIAVRTD